MATGVATVFVWALGLSTAIALAQQRDDSGRAPAFEAASVKPNNSGENAMNNRFTPSQAVYINYTVRSLVSTAYQITPDRLLGWPDWTARERFDITAAIPPGPPGADRRPMLQRLLADRFGLKTHRDTRELPVYLLVKARADGRLGPGLRPSTLDCSGPARSTCGTSIRLNSISGRSTDWESLNLPLQLGLDRPAVDRTGLSGAFDIELQWSREVSPTGDQTSVFTAIEDQLGLKLVAGRAPVDVLIIDSVSRPLPD